jgi:hypothetical protein
MQMQELFDGFWDLGLESGLLGKKADAGEASRERKKVNN